VATTKTAPKQGDTYNLTALDGHGTGIGSLPKGTKVCVDLVHNTVVPGVGGNEGVLFSWVPDDAVDPRSAHLPQDEFLRLFKKVGK